MPRAKRKAAAPKAKAPKKAKPAPKKKAEEPALAAPEAAAPSVDALLAARDWAGLAKALCADGVEFDEAVVAKVQAVAPTAAMASALEGAGYLEKYLWPAVSASENPSAVHALAIAAMLNEKCAQHTSSPWEICADEAKFASFFSALLDAAKALFTPGVAITAAHGVVVRTLINCVQSLEVAPVRHAVAPLFSLPLWTALGAGRRAHTLNQYPNLKRHYARMLAKQPKILEEHDATFMPTLLTRFLSVVGTEGSNVLELELTINVLELLCDALSQLPTRRFLVVLLKDLQFGPMLRLSPRVASLPPASQHRVALLVERYLTLENFEVDDQSGLPLGPAQIKARKLERVALLQRVAYKELKLDPNAAAAALTQDDADAGLEPAIDALVFSSAEGLSDRAALKRLAASLGPGIVTMLLRKVHVLPAEVDDESAWHAPLRRALADDADDAFLTEVMLYHCCKRATLLERISATPVFPTEGMLYSPFQIPDPLHSLAVPGEKKRRRGGAFAGTRTKSMNLPKLGLAYLSVHDYLMRSYALYQLESAYGIREDVTEVARRMQALVDHAGGVSFQGWARMAVTLKRGALKIHDVKPPRLGEAVPAEVRATISVDLRNVDARARSEWDQLREHDVLLVLTLTQPTGDGPAPAPDENGEESEEASTAKVLRALGVAAVRGCTIKAVEDESGNAMNDPGANMANQKGKANPNGPAEPYRPKGMKRTYKVQLDPAQFLLDQETQPSPDPYIECNVLMRRDPKQNNFKAVLETIRDLMISNSQAVHAARRAAADEEEEGGGGPSADANPYGVLPTWLHDAFLGYGDPAAAHFSRLAADAPAAALNFTDTFEDAAHLREAFPDYKVEVSGDLKAPFFRVTFPPSDPLLGPDARPKGKGKKKPVIAAEGFTPEVRSPFPAPPQRRKKAVRFTPTQVGAIRAGMHKGLTLIQGPPGTGKTDVTVQLVLNLYHTFPGERILLVTHSNAALNDLFAKLATCDIDGRHMLRLGSGSRDLQSVLANADVGLEGGYDFSKWGRVNSILAKRQDYLGKVSALADSLGLDGEGVSATCETALYFKLYHVTSRIERYEAAVAAGGDGAAFPFKKFFGDLGVSVDDGDAETIGVCLKYLEDMFDELESARAFEVLRTHRNRSDYLLLKQARITAMTVTHAALNRQRLIDLRYKYDSVVMEESGQVMDIEAFVTLTLQEHNLGEPNRLKRVVLVGDHKQLPPIVSHSALKGRYGLEQSMFQRLVNAKFPYVSLDAQGRARPELADLYRWRYPGLTDLPHTVGSAGNPGLAHAVQCVHVKGTEAVPTPHFIQNLDEAEWLVQTFLYLVGSGYAPQSIALLTPYRGQKALLTDVLTSRYDISLGAPAVETVDSFQGQQADIVLLSLVRTRHVGHLRDLRRLTVAVSRARLGLYVFADLDLFMACEDLAPVFNQLAGEGKPRELELVFGEQKSADGTPLERKADAAPHKVATLAEMSSIVLHMQNAAAAAPMQE